MCLKLEHAKFYRSGDKGAFSNWKLNGRGVRSLMENWPYAPISETVRDKTKIKHTNRNFGLQ